ncbi:hypothetical protein KDX16_33610 [Burkholderia vietnamiensis]|jgi:hypothetical protein|uniref:Uncharacterized protein n=3 Tax=Burkholderia cepacia complex TaxID=87882 RepID=A0AAP4VPR2_9BURK|nr:MULTISPECIES: hypothetical protein [Burkholderia]HDR9758766.1 hypothetical protein [Burkholderia cepacia ATCC 25416]MBR7920740.1 hypothetical protein [Burkholderia vietnamiensis]MBR8054835.1 hypothetical protein [Burkholderia vietnamiensis]MDN7570091.1 hypothetical protein [Burkholderia contaminans]VWC52303.1 hypothetical protein BLA13014_07952 [Burkholderia aenigmatica]
MSDVTKSGQTVPPQAAQQGAIPVGWRRVPDIPAAETLEFYGDQYSVPVLLHDGERIMPVVARWDFTGDGWVDAQCRDGPSPEDYEWMNSRAKCWMLLDATLQTPGQAIISQPIPMLLFCPACGLQHVDAPEPAHDGEEEWDNPPHRSHKCHACATVWRPADVPTVGVASIQTSGQADNWDRSACTVANDAPEKCAGCVARCTNNPPDCYARPVADDAAGARDERTAPFANCSFHHCDLPGQCKSEGTCHHPARAAGSLSDERRYTQIDMERYARACMQARDTRVAVAQAGAVRTVTIEEAEKRLLRKLLSFAREIDIKWHRDRNEICRIKLDVRDGESMAPRLIEHRVDLIREFVSTARNAFSAGGGAEGDLVAPDQTTEAAR